MIALIDNFNSSNYSPYRDIQPIGKLKKDNEADKKVIGEKLEINLKHYQAKSTNNIFFSFFKNDAEKRDSKNEDDLIIFIKKDGENYLAQTGNYVGKLVWDGLEIDIKSRFSNTFLERMLNFSNDIFLDDVSIAGDKVKEDFDISKLIIYYMFIQNLEKAFLLGLPKAYKSIDHHEMKLKGKIDINKFIKYDIPFQGKVSSVSREQKEIQEIIDILYKSVKIIEKSNFPTKNISHIKTHLKQCRSNKYVSNETINKALKSKALQNPIFAPYKKVLEYAKFIINNESIKESSDDKNNTYGFIINIAELFEVYMSKLLQKEFSDWSVQSPKIELYENMFYKRKIIPDIVMVQDNNSMVFDTKYKRMTMKGRDHNGAGDVDRNDFFQINTYMSYYKSQGHNIKVGGLLYPMEKFELEQCYSQTWFGKPDTKFIIDGIDLSGELEVNDKPKFHAIVEQERLFISRIQNLLNQT